MTASAIGETLRVLWGPGLVFLVVLIWLIRRIIRAARNESRLEEERLREWMKNEVAQMHASKAEPRLMRVPPAAQREKALNAARTASNPALEPIAAPGSSPAAAPAGAGSDSGAGAAPAAAEDSQAAVSTMPPPGDSIAPPVPPARDSTAAVMSKARDSTAGPMSPARDSTAAPVTPPDRPEAPPQIELAPISLSGPAGIPAPVDPEAGALLAAFDAADRAGVSPAEIEAIRPLVRGDGSAPGRVLWVRSTGSHVAFCERREAVPPSTVVRDVITVVKLAGGKIVGKWQFG